MNIKKTRRGFSLYEFNDLYNQKCNIQKSSLATDDAIWLGLVDAEPVILASNAIKHGISTVETTGWVNYPLSEDVLLHTRMHLNREQVKNLLPILEKFVKTGEI